MKDYTKKILLLIYNQILKIRRIGNVVISIKYATVLLNVLFVDKDKLLIELLF